MAVDVLTVVVAALLAASVTACIYPALGYLSLYKQLLTLLATMALLFPLFGLYPGAGLNPVRELRQLTLATSLAFLVLTIANLGFGKLSKYEATFLSFHLALTLFFGPIGRHATRCVFGSFAWWGERALIVGDGPQGAKLVESLAGQPHVGLRPAGIVDHLNRHWAEGPERDMRLYLGPLDELSAIADRQQVRWAIIAASDFAPGELPHIVQKCAGVLPHLTVLLDIDGMPSLWHCGQECAGQPGISVRQSLLSPMARRLKRFVDLVLVLLGGALLLPVIAAIALAIRLSSPGSAFFQQERVGRHGRRFRMWKFRTMAVNAQERLEECLHSDPELRREWQSRHKLRRDPRVVKGIGTFLRRSSLDELPQLWNVLVGEMSLVGPRPIVANEEGRSYLTDFSESYRRYIRVAPGITGLWQISGRNDISYEQRIHLDTYYISNWSLWLDLYILLGTAKAVLWGRGAY